MRLATCSTTLPWVTAGGATNFSDLLESQETVRCDVVSWIVAQALLEQSCLFGFGETTCRGGYSPSRFLGSSLIGTSWRFEQSTTVTTFSSNAICIQGRWINKTFAAKDVYSLQQHYGWYDISLFKDETGVREICCADMKCKVVYCCTFFFVFTEPNIII
jgi:hypothetical protein